MQNRIIVEDYLTFPVNLQEFRVLGRCSAAIKRLPLDTSIRSTGEHFLQINFLRLIHLEIFLKEFHLNTCKEIEKLLLEIQK